MSDIDPSLPQEATVPAVCGILIASMDLPGGGADTGAKLGLLGAGLRLGAGTYAVRRSGAHGA